MSEVSGGGSEILRHQPREREFEPTGGDAELVEAVDAHLARHVGEPEEVFHELVSDLVHLDVHRVPPSDERPWTTLITSGMAERPMTVPDGLEDHRFAELTLALPPDWPLSMEAFGDETHYWPLRLLKSLARLPHEYETYLYWGHTVPNGEPPEPYASNTELSCALILPPVLEPEEFARFKTSDGRTVHVYAVVPIHADEMQLKLDKGADTLMTLFDEHDITELLDPRRASVAPRRRGLFRR
jgi:glycerophosphoryl diester phosphodiesterase